MDAVLHHLPGKNRAGATVTSAAVGFCGGGPIPWDRSLFFGVAPWKIQGNIKDARLQGARPRPFDRAPRDLSMNRAVARFTKSNPLRSRTLAARITVRTITVYPSLLCWSSVRRTPLACSLHRDIADDH